MMRGVCWNERNKRWRAHLAGGGKNGYLGEFRTEEEAIKARRDAELRVDGRVHESASIVRIGKTSLVPIFGRRGVIKACAAVSIQDESLVSGPIWALTKSGYAVARIGQKVVYMHRLIISSGDVVDHIDGDKLNNVRSNLRPCTQKENSRNCKISKNNKVGFKGVIRRPSGFAAGITVYGKWISLGLFKAPEEAAYAYDRAAKKMFGDYARTNFHTPEYVKDAQVHITIKPLEA